jgi:beta-lactamase superfamily II metal-dependent hydrolase
MSHGTRAVSDLIVRVYDVRFGDAVLVSIPDKAGGHDVERHILFDFGNALDTAAGVDTVFEPVIDDIKARLKGKPLDLFVMTHEHLDHVQGPFYCHETFNKDFKARQVWLTGSANPDYYDTHPDARKKKKAALAAFRATQVRLRAAPDPSPFAALLLANNDVRSTAKCVDHLRTKLAKPAKVRYVDRTTDLSKIQPAKSATVTLWAPEEDTAEYYGMFEALAASMRIGDSAVFDDLDLGLEEPTDLREPEPPRGVDAGAFYNLLDVRHSGSASTLLNIDQAANNTSVVTLIEWHGWRLLFTGDAEKRSWRQMDKQGLVGPVHFLKVSHHGSSTGMPPDAILDKLLPMPAPPGFTRRAAVSTFPGKYPGVPNDHTLDELRRRTTLQSTLDLPAGQSCIELAFPSAGPQ